MLVATSCDAWQAPFGRRGSTSPRRIMTRSGHSRFTESTPNLSGSSLKVRPASPPVRAMSPVPLRQSLKVKLVQETPRRERASQGRKASKTANEPSTPTMLSQSLLVPVNSSGSFVPFPLAAQTTAETSVWKWVPKGKNMTPAAAGMARACRILCYGDSLTAGFCQGGRQYQPYAASLAEAMMMGGAACEVGVCGLVGHTARSMINELSSSFCRDITGRPGKGLSRILDEETPIDLVLLMVGTNDLGQGFVPQEIADDICKLHSMCHARGVPTISISPPTVTSMQRRYIRSNRDQLADILAARIGARVGHDDGVLAHFDAEELLPRMPGTMFWEPDQIHFSAAGSVHLGKLLAAWILPAVVDAFKPVLCSTPPGSPKPFGHRSTRHSTTTLRSTSRTRSPARTSMGSRTARGRLESQESVSGDEKVQAVLPSRPSPCLEVSQSSPSFISPSSPVSVSSREERSPTLIPENVTSVAAVEVWSKTHDQWCKGLVRKMKGSQANVEYILPSGGLARKELSIDHRELRLLQSAKTIASSTAVMGSAVRKTCSTAPLSPTPDFRHVAVH